MPKDWWMHPDAKAWIARTQEQLPGMIEGSTVTISIVPNEEPDVKYCVELGMCIMLDKPIIAVVRPGTKVPEHLVRVADAIIECDMDDDEDREKLAVSLRAEMDRLTP